MAGFSGTSDAGTSVWLGLNQTATNTGTGHDNGKNFVGGLDEFRIFSSALTATQLDSLRTTNSISISGTFGLPAGNRCHHRRRRHGWICPDKHSQHSARSRVPRAASWRSERQA